MQIWRIKGENYTHAQLMDLKKQGLNPRKDNIVKKFIANPGTEEEIEKAEAKMKVRKAKEERENTRRAKMVAIENAEDEERKKLVKEFQVWQMANVKGDKKKREEVAKKAEEAKEAEEEAPEATPEAPEKAETLAEAQAEVPEEEVPAETEEQEFERLKTEKAWVNPEKAARYKELRSKFVKE